MGSPNPQYQVGIPYDLTSIQTIKRNILAGAQTLTVAQSGSLVLFNTAAGYTVPTPIQAQAIPVVLEGRDILGLAQTGTGKTAAFVLPILQRLTKGLLNQPRVLIVAPTRELAEQINQTIVTLGKKTKVHSVTIYGGVGKMPQVAALRRGAEIIVACPGRLLDLIDEGAVDVDVLEFGKIADHAPTRLSNSLVQIRL